MFTIIVNSRPFEVFLHCLPLWLKVFNSNRGLSFYRIGFYHFTEWMLLLLELQTKHCRLLHTAFHGVLPRQFTNPTKTWRVSLLPCQHTRREMSLVNAEIKYIREIQNQHSLILAEKLQVAISESSLQHRRHDDLKHEHAELMNCYPRSTASNE